MKVEIELTDEMKEARKYCGEDSDCWECPCCIGEDDCVYNHIDNEETYK